MEIGVTLALWTDPQEELLLYHYLETVLFYQVRASHQNKFVFFLNSQHLEKEREQMEAIDKAVEVLELQKVQSQSNVKQVQL